jgi:hypothetical protein
MKREPKSIADIRRRLHAIEDDLNAMAGRVRDKARGHKLALAADIVTDLRAVDLSQPVLSGKR